MAKSKLSDIRLWNLIANSAKNNIEAGGWFNSYTYLPFSEKEMDEYVRDTECLLSQFISKDSIVLEIGCSSGVTMKQLCRQVAKYIGIDISNREIEWCRKTMIENHIANYELYVLPADRIDTLLSEFNIIILNSVVHCFDDKNYLINVLSKSCALLNGSGIIYIGDIMALEKKQELLSSLNEFKKINPHSKTKTSLDQELLLSRNFFASLPETLPSIKKVSFYEKSGTINNELKKYRYNVILEIDVTNHL